MRKKRLIEKEDAIFNKHQNTEMKRKDDKRKKNELDHQIEEKLKRNQLNAKRMGKRRLIEKEEAIYYKSNEEELKRNDAKRKKNELDHENKEKN